MKEVYLNNLRKILARIEELDAEYDSLDNNPYADVDRAKIVSELNTLHITADGYRMVLVKLHKWDGSL